MENRKMNLVDYEKIVLEKTVANHKREYKLVESLLDVYATGFGLIKHFDSKDNEPNFLWVLLISHSFQSLRSSFEIAQKGYYWQSMALIRTVTEDYFICGNAPKNNFNVIGVILHNDHITFIDKKGKARELDSFNYYNLACKIDALDIYEADYKYECKFTHSTSLSAGTIVKPNSDKTRVIQPMPIYDKILFHNCCERWFKNALYMLTLMASLVNKEGSDLWLIELQNAIKETNKWFENLKKEYEAYQP
jgi:hypothetical protein